MLDAKLLGVVTRNIAAMPNPTAETLERAKKIRDEILRRYNAMDVLGCLLMIALRVRANRD
jgi:hypothetical protein